MIKISKRLKRLKEPKDPQDSKESKDPKRTRLKRLLFGIPPYFSIWLAFSIWSNLIQLQSNIGSLFLSPLKQLQLDLKFLIINCGVTASVKCIFFCLSTKFLWYALVNLLASYNWMSLVRILDCGWSSSKLIEVRINFT